MGIGARNSAVTPAFWTNLDWEIAMRVLPPIIAALMLSAAGIAFAQPSGSDLKFSYSYPSQARAIPALKAWLDRDAAADRREAVNDKRPFNPYEAQRTWKVVTDTPRFLSLSAEAYDFTGGAHGNTAFDSLVWDKAARVRLAPMSFFASKPALAGAVKAAFCRQLNAERSRKRNGEMGSDAEFNACISPTDQTVILGSSNRQQFNRIGFLIAPYNAGPYAEGTYEVTLPVTPQVIAAVKPQWRRYFAVTH